MSHSSSLVKLGHSCASIKNKHQHVHNENSNMLMFNRYNVYNVSHLNLEVAAGG